MRATSSRRALHAQDGFTLVELLATVLLLTVGLLAVVSTFDYTRSQTGTGERLEVMAHAAEAESERIIGLPYATVGLSSVPAPAAAADPNDPLTHVAASPPSYAYDWSNSGSYEPFVTTATSAGCSCTLAPSTAWTDGRYSGTMYRFITWVNDGCGACNNAKDYKRVTVVVSVAGHAPVVSSAMARLRG